ncbi:hypothetical protein LSAT2_012028 [Lamellibrachia satsuma]|nr:hypothetical protein LSAT2_012028 [Lamellibrachia satsuma]
MFPTSYIATSTDSELETVKKCTPLYGQPSWWGGWYDDGPDEKPSQDNGRLNDKRTGSGTYIAERPSSLSLHPTTATPPPSNTCSPSHAISQPSVVDLPGTHQPPVNDGYVSESERLLEDFKQRTLKAALWTPPRSVTRGRGTTPNTCPLN